MAKQHTLIIEGLLQGRSMIKLVRFFEFPNSTLAVLRDCGGNEYTLSICDTQPLILNDFQKMMGEEK